MLGDAELAWPEYKLTTIQDRSPEIKSEFPF
jgi:hypothetical protein